MTVNRLVAAVLCDAYASNTACAALSHSLFISTLTQAIMRHGFDNWTTLAAIDPHNSVLYQRRPAGLVTAARDCVLLRTWRRDVDGSYIILLQDTEHAAAPAPGGGFLGGTVRAHVRNST